MYHKVIVNSLIICLLYFSPLYALQSGAKSTGLSPVEQITDFNDVEEHLREIKRAIDFLHREMLNDVDIINRDVIPTLQTQVDAIGTADFDIPLVANLNFRYKATNIIKWDAGTLQYGGVSYVVSEGTSDEEDIAVYVDVSSLSDPITLQHGATVTYKPDIWFLANRISTKVYASFQSPIINGGLIQANTITANEIKASTILLENVASQVTDRMFDSSTKSNYIQAWQHDTDTTKIDGGDIYTSTVTATAIDVANLFAQDLTMTGSGEIHTTGKDIYGDTTAGYWIGMDSGTAKFDFGNATQHIKWDGTDLVINGQKGTLGITGSSYSLENGLMTVVGTGIWTGDTLTVGNRVSGRPVFNCESSNSSIAFSASQMSLDTSAANQFSTIEFTNGSIGTASTGANVKYCHVNIGPSASNRILMNESLSIYLINGFTIDDSIITGSTINNTNSIAADALDSGVIADAQMPASPPSDWFASGTYTGDGVSTEVVTHGLGHTPKLIIVGCDDSPDRNTQTWTTRGGSSAIGSVGNTTFTITEGTGGLELNSVGEVFYWVCF